MNDLDTVKGRQKKKKLMKAYRKEAALHVKTQAQEIVNNMIKKNKLYKRLFFISLFFNIAFIAAILILIWIILLLNVINVR